MNEAELMSHWREFYQSLAVEDDNLRSRPTPDLPEVMTNLFDAVGAKVPTTCTPNGKSLYS